MFLRYLRGSPRASVQGGGVVTGNVVRVNGNGLGGVVSLVNPDKSVSKFKHVVTETNDDELSILSSLLKQGIYPNNYTYIQL